MARSLYLQVLPVDIVTWNLPQSLVLVLEAPKVGVRLLK